MTLGNPPIIEAWLGFNFQSREDAPEWSVESATSFLERFTSDFDEHQIELRKREQFYVDHRTEDGVPTKVHISRDIDRLRIGDADGSKWLQMGENLLSYHLIRGDAGYPGWTSLRGEAVRFLDAYCRDFSPESVRSALLHYVDLVEIPLAQGEQIQIEDYFRLGIREPGPPFDSPSGFALRLAFSSGNANNQINVHFGMELPKYDVSESDQLDLTPVALRFKLEWHVECKAVDALGTSEITQRVNEAHEELYECFRNCFTERGWQLFDPKGE